MIGSQNHLTVCAVPWVPGVISKGLFRDYFKDASFEMNKFQTKEPKNLRKCYDSEGATQLHLRSDHFVSMIVF